MSRDEKQDPDAEGGKDRSPRAAADSDRPVELTKRARRPDVALKIVRTSRSLDADGERIGPPPPGVITVGGVNEAKAYVPAMRPAAGSKPTSEPDSQRVRVADPRRAPTERLDPAVLAAIRAKYDEDEGGVAANNAAVASTSPAPREAPREPERTEAAVGVSTRLLVLGILIGVLVAFVPVVLYLKLRAPPARAPTEAPTSGAAAAQASSEPPSDVSPAPSGGPHAPPSPDKPASSADPISTGTAPSITSSAPVSSLAPAVPRPVVSGSWVKPKSSATPKATTVPTTSPTLPPELVN